MFACSLLFVWATSSIADGHSYLAQPASRNLLANLDGEETCPHCLQSGGPDNVQERGQGMWPTRLAPESHGLCGDPVQGKSNPPTFKDETYLKKGPITATYRAGEIVEFQIAVSTHHMGHYEFRICDAGYLPPAGSQTPVAGADWKDTMASTYPSSHEVHVMRYKIPDNLSCEACTLQWYWSTGNSCLYDFDYVNYFKEFAKLGWDADAWHSQILASWRSCENSCCNAEKFGEEFWNCADIAVLPGSTGSSTSSVEASTATTTTTSTSTTTTTTTTVSIITDDEFNPVDGGEGRACRGAHPADNAAAYYTVVAVSSLEDCKAECSKVPVCRGVEFSGQRCEIWSRPEGIEASIPLAGFTCLRYGSYTTTTLPQMGTFEPVDGGEDRACRGANVNDNLPSHYTVLHDIGSLDRCKVECAKVTSCAGIEFSGSRCEVWTRKEGIEATKVLKGFQCLRYMPPVATTTTTTKPDGFGCSAAWGACGGRNWNGANCCVDGYTCVEESVWYWQCRPTESASLVEVPGLQRRKWKSFRGTTMLQDGSSLTRTSVDDELLKDSKPVERKKAEEPGYQVQTDFGWTRYDATAQEQIRSAASKGRPDCEIFAQGQYYKVDLKRMVQINPSTGNERTVRLAGLPQPAPEMPKLNFKRLLVEFKQVEAAIAAGEAAPCAHTAIEEWEVDMSFPAESDLQKSLENLAASMFDTRLNRLTLCVRFTVEFPLSPPEVWLRRPRMRYREGKTGPVTFGGRVCSLLLASAGWQPATSMLSASIQLERLNTELFHTVNGFCREGMTALSPEAAQPFLGDLKRLEVTDKIGLPLSYANSIYQRAELGDWAENAGISDGVLCDRLLRPQPATLPVASPGADLVLPMIFEIKTLLGRKSHCAIFEFFDGLPEMHVLIPKWVMEDLAIDEREPVRVRGVELDLVTSVKVQPHSVDFYHAVRDSGREVRELLTESLARFSTLTEDTAVPIEVNEKFFQDMDVQHHFEFKVEFEPAPDLEDEAATKEYQDRVLNSIKLRRERSAAGRQERDADTHYEEDNERWRERMGARAWALLSMIVGCLLVVVAMAGAKSEAIYLMDRVVRVDTAGPYGNSLDGASRVLTTMSLVHMLLFMGLIVFFISLLGITATQGRHKCTAAVYGVSSASCAAVILMMSMQILQRVQVTQPIMDRQVQHLCNASTYIQLGAAQHCFWASKYGAAPPCEAACSWKVTVLQNGCKVMPQLCESFQYQAVENCTSGFHGLSSNFFIASTNASACRQACDADIQCQDFAHLRPTVARPELCLLFSGTQQLHPAPAWSSVAPSQATAYFEESTCWKRGDPTILETRTESTLFAFLFFFLCGLTSLNAWIAVLFGTRRLVG
eukprot:g30895.t1